MVSKVQLYRYLYGGLIESSSAESIKCYVAFNDMGTTISGLMTFHDNKLCISLWLNIYARNLGNRAVFMNIIIPASNFTLNFATTPSWNNTVVWFPQHNTEHTQNAFIRVFHL